MSPDKQKSLDAMRTYARDVAREKGEEPETKPTPKKEPEPKKIESKPMVTPSPAKKAEKAPEESKEPTKKTPKQIPPFHELQKAIRTDIKAETEKPKPATKKTKGIEPSRPVAGGTVITDNKNARPSFFAEIQKSFEGWVLSIKKALKPKKKNTYAVSKTERRRGVVQKATSKTGTIFTADSETLREQIKARQRAERHEHDDLTWSPYTEPGYPLLEGDEAESTDSRVTKVSITPKTRNAPKSVIKPTEKIQELQEKKEEDDELLGVPVAEPEPETEPETLTEQPVDVPGETEQAPEPFVPDQASDVEDDDLVDNEPEEEWNFDDVSLKDTNTLAMLLVGIALGVGIIGFVIFGIFGAGDTTDDVEPVVVETAIYSDSPLTDAVLPEQTFNALVSTFNSAVIAKETGDTVEFKIVGDNGLTVPTNVIMSLLRTQKTDEFADVVDTVRFIHTDTNERAILLTSPDTTSALGGMLNWEDSLLGDLGPILDINNIPPSAGTFVDQQIGELDARSLVFETETLLTYALVNQSTVIITTNVSVLDKYVQN